MQGAVNSWFNTTTLKGSELQSIVPAGGDVCYSQALAEAGVLSATEPNCKPCVRWKPPPAPLIPAPLSFSPFLS